jgi:hypothetical protein
MALRDFYSNAAVRMCLLPASYAATTNSIVIDTFGFRSGAIFLAVGAITGAAQFSAKLQDSPDGVTFTDVVIDLRQSDAPPILAQNFSYRLGYLGGKRYLRLQNPLASGTSAILSAVFVGEPLLRPVP